MEKIPTEKQIEQYKISQLSKIATNFQNGTSINELPPCENAGEGYDMLAGLFASNEDDLLKKEYKYVVTSLPFINKKNIGEKILLGWDDPNFTMIYGENELATPTNSISRESWPLFIITNFNNMSDSIYNTDFNNGSM